MTYIILFKDLTMTVAAMKPVAGHYHSEARFFEAEDTMTVQDLSECYYFQWNRDNFTERLLALITEL